jgi:hypothetical protein
VDVFAEDRVVDRHDQPGSIGDERCVDPRRALAGELMAGA